LYNRNGAVLISAVDIDILCVGVKYKYVKINAKTFLLATSTCFNRNLLEHMSVKMKHGEMVK